MNPVTACMARRTKGSANTNQQEKAGKRQIQTGEAGGVGVVGVMGWGCLDGVGVRVLGGGACCSCDCLYLNER